MSIFGEISFFMKPKSILKLERELGINLTPMVSNLNPNYADINTKKNQFYCNENDELISLILKENELQSISFMIKFKQVQYLDLSYNEISDISVLKELTQLTVLNLANNQIEEVSPLVGLTQLTELNLTNNHIEEVSSLAGLSQLKELYLGYNKIADVSALVELTQLISLDLSNNLITTIDSLRELKKITYLDLAGNIIVDISALKDLTELKNLYLEKNQIIDVSSLANLHELVYVYLNNNQITDISPIIELKNLDILSLSGNPVLDDSIPKEVIESDWNAIKEYLINEKAKSLLQFNDVKVLLLGNPNVGKSHLLSYLETNKVPKKQEATQGICYKKIEKGKLNLHVWDFGGQEYFHATHKLFFSPSALNLVLWSKEDIQRDDTNPEACFNIEYWLRTIEQLNKQSNTETILLENKIDLNDYIASPIDFKNLSVKYPTLQLNYTNISLQELKRTEGFKELLLERANTLTNDYPSYYKQILDQIKDKDIATVSSVKIPKVTNSDVSSAFQVLHNMGMVLYFETILPYIVFPKPQLLLDLLYEKVLAKDKKDRLTLIAIENAIKGNVLKLNSNDVLSLLLYFDLIFTIPTEKNTYFIPQYLNSPPALIDFFEKHQFSIVNMKIFGDNYLMSLIMLKIFSRYGKDVKGKETKEYLFWKDGIVIEKDSVIVMLKFKREEQTIELYTDTSFSNFDLQLEIVEFVLNIPHEDEKKSKFKEAYPVLEYLKSNIEKTKDLPERRQKSKEYLDKTTERFRKYNLANELNFESDYLSVFVSNDGNYFVKWNDLNEHLKKGIFSILEQNKETVEKKVSLFNYSRYLSLKNKHGMKKIFISYSKDDLELVNSYIKSLQPLLLEGTLSDVWYCTYLSPGEEVHEKIKTKMENADIVCFMCSNNFYATKYIIENELKPTLKRKMEGGKQLILPIIIDRCKWVSDNQEINLGKFAGFPYRGKPVSDFSNWNDAWYVMNWYLEEVIKKNEQPNEEGYFDSITDLPSDINELLKRQIDNELSRKA